MAIPSKHLQRFLFQQEDGERITAEDDEDLNLLELKWAALASTVKKNYGEFTWAGLAADILWQEFICPMYVPILAEAPNEVADQEPSAEAKEAAQQFMASLTSQFRPISSPPKDNYEEVEMDLGSDCDNSSVDLPQGESLNESLSLFS